MTSILFSLFVLKHFLFMRRNISKLNCLRYMTILRPRAPHLSMASTSMFLVSIWVTSIMVAIPTLLYSTTVSYGEDMILSRTACIMVILS